MMKTKKQTLGYDFKKPELPRCSEDQFVLRWASPSMSSISAMATPRHQWVLTHLTSPVNSYEQLPPGLRQRWQRWQRWRWFSPYFIHTLNLLGA